MSVQRVTVDISPEEMPGKPKRTVMCERCGEKVMDGKDILVKEEPLCLACAEGPYYTVVEERGNEIGT